MGIGIIIGNRIGRSSDSWSPEASALFARFTTPATIELKTNINILIKGLIDGGYWDRIDCLQKYNLLAPDQIVCNFKENRWNGTIVGELELTKRKGIKKGGQFNITALPASYMNTGFIPSEGVNFQLNNCSWIQGKSKIIDVSGYFEGCQQTDVTSLSHRNVGTYTRINGSASGVTAALIVGYTAYNRSSVNVIRVFVNNAWQQITPASIARPYLSTFVGANNVEASAPVDTAAKNESKTELYGANFNDAETAAIIALLETFDNAMNPVPNKPFNNGKVSFIFDDNAASLTANAIALFNSYGIVGAYAAGATSTGGVNTNWTLNNDMYNAGWELLFHGNVHNAPNYYPNMTEAQIRADIEDGIAVFHAHGYATPLCNAYVFGDFSNTIETIIKDYFIYARRYHAIENMFANTQKTRMLSYSNDSNYHTQAQRLAMLDLVEANKSAIIFTNHGIDMTNSGLSNKINLADLTELITVSQAKGLDIILPSQLGALLIEP